MKQEDIQNSIGKAVTINGFRDLGCDYEMRRIIGEEGTLIKKCKSGLLQVEVKAKLYSVPPINVDLKKEQPHEQNS